MKKSVITVKYTLMLVLITIILLGLAAVISWLLNFYRGKICIQEQIKIVNDIEGLVGGVRMTGSPEIESIKINGVCAECIWYNKSARQVEIKFKDATTPVPINVSMQWNGVSTDWGCGSSNMKAGQTHIIEVAPNNILCVTCE